jgi:hypothetical protein
MPDIETVLAANTDIENMPNSAVAFLPSDVQPIIE